MDTKEIIQKYQSGETISALSRENNCSIDKIRWILEKANVLVKRREAKYSLSEQEIIKLYMKDVPIKDIASKFGCSVSPVISILKKNNIYKPALVKYFPVKLALKLMDKEYFQQLVAACVTQKNLMKELNCGQSQVNSLLAHHNIKLQSSRMGHSLLNQQKADYVFCKSNFIFLYEEKRYPLNKIAELFGISSGYLRQMIRDEWKYTVREPNETNSSPAYLQLKKSPDELKELILTKKLTLREIAEQHDCCVDSVWKLAKEFNIQVPIKYQSSGERDILNFLQEALPDTEILTNTRNIISPLELDIYIPSLKLAIEYNGLYWHNETNKTPSYHLEKTEVCEEHGIRLIHIFEDEWREQNRRCKETLLHFLGKSEQGVYARNTTTKEIPWSEAKSFLNKYHLLGAGSPGNYRVGAFDKNEELIGVMVFGSKNNEGAGNSDIVELKRFVTNKKNNPGLGSKMFKYAIKQKHYEEIIAFVDRRWFTGLVKDHIGFKVDGYTIPALWWTDNYNRHHRRYKTKKQLISQLTHIPNIENMSKREMMEILGFVRIFDCGKVRLLWNAEK